MIAIGLFTLVCLAIVAATMSLIDTAIRGRRVLAQLREERLLVPTVVEVRAPLRVELVKVRRPQPRRQDCYRGVLGAAA